MISVCLFRGGYKGQQFREKGRVQQKASSLEQALRGPVLRILDGPCPSTPLSPKSHAIIEGNSGAGGSWVV